MLIVTGKYSCMHYILAAKGMCCESRDVFKFWEIMVHDRGIVAMEV